MQPHVTSFLQAAGTGSQEYLGGLQQGPPDAMLQYCVAESHDSSLPQANVLAVLAQPHRFAQGSHVEPRAAQSVSHVHGVVDRQLPDVQPASASSHGPAYASGLDTYPSGSPVQIMLIVEPSHAQPGENASQTAPGAGKQVPFATQAAALG